MNTRHCVLLQKKRAALYSEMRGASRKETDRSNVSWYGGKGDHAPVPGFCPQRVVREGRIQHLGVAKLRKV